MQELVKLGQLGPLTLTAYALCLTVGAAAAVLLTAVLGRKNPGVNAALSMSMAGIVGAMLGGRLLYCLTQLEFILVDLGGAAFMLKPWEGGYTMYGALLGGMAGVTLYARATKRSAGRLLDLAAPGAALAIAAGRLGEAFTGQGLGAYVENEALHMFPFAVQNLYEDWQLPVFAYEAAVAVAVLLVCLCLLRGSWLMNNASSGVVLVMCRCLQGSRHRAGRVAEVFLALVSLCQIMLESLRADEFIRFGFVKFNMLAAAAVIGVLMGLSVWRRVRHGGWKPWQMIRLVLLAVTVTVVILIEFALDKSPVDNRLLYAVMALMLSVMGISVLREGK
ncbi:MAG: prolipoprotein diacylglyceryl transferase family protein [Aristaeellaceae bacterium]